MTLTLPIELTNGNEGRSHDNDDTPAAALVSAYLNAIGAA